jgi:DNA-binding NtrC family response regulator
MLTADPDPHPMSADTLSILLVEDDEVVRTSMRFALETHPIAVIEAESVAEALRRFSEQPIDVVVADLHLPDGTGYDLARRLWPQHPNLPLVVISTDLVTDPLGAIAQGRRMTTMAKPFSISALLDAISRVTSDQPGLG